MPQKLTNEIITAAIDGFEHQKTRLDDQIRELRAMLDGNPRPTDATPEPPTGKRRKFSAAARRKMAMAQKARWAKIKGESEPQATTPEPVKRKRKMSAAGRAAISAATKKRWALKRAADAAKAAPKKAPRKKAARKAAKKKTTAPSTAATSANE
jgi:hypothetical protein